MPVATTPPSGYTKINLKYGPYSASRLLVARCPAKFESRYVRRERVVGDGLNTSRGSAIHLVLEHITKKHVARESITPRELDTWIQQAVAEYPAAYAQIDLIKSAAAAYVGNPSPYINETTKCEVPLSVHLYEQESFLDDTVPNRAYVRAEPGDRTAFISMIADQISVDPVNKFVTILDHKSTPSSNRNADVDFQLGVYAFMGRILAPEYTIRTVIHYAHPDLNFYSAPVMWTDEDLRMVEDDLLLRIGAVESFTEYPAVAGSGCEYCHMVGSCPEYLALEAQNARGEIDLNVRTVEDLTRIAKKLRVVGVLYDGLNKTLKKGIENICPMSGIAIDNYWYGFKGSESIDWDATGFRAREFHARGEFPFPSLEHALQAHGVEPLTFQKWKPSERLRNLMKHDKTQLIDLLKKIVVVEKNTKFGGYKL